MKQNIIKSISAMLIAWALVCIGLVIIEGNQDGIAGISGLFLMGLIFIILAWLVFILPFLKLMIRKLAESNIVRFLFPFFTAFYGFFAFVCIFCLLTLEFSIFIDFFKGTSLLGNTSLSVGFLWGLIFLIFKPKLQVS